MSEQKVVKCRCGKDMHPYHGQYYSGCRYWARYECECGWCAPLIVGDTADEAIEVAYLAATPTPPNRPMTREQVEAMDDLDAVWEVFDFGLSCLNSHVLIITGKAAKDDFPITSMGDIMMFASRPTPADIEAARKERND